MRKQELIHTHGLLAEVYNYLVEKEGRDIDTPEYDQHRTSPTAIHKSKTAHKSAVFALAADINEHVEQVEAAEVAAD